MKILHSKIDKVQNETAKDDNEKASNKLSILKCEEALLDAVHTLISSDRLDAFFIFGFFLRKFDDNVNTLTKSFLGGETRNSVEEALKNMVKSNYYDSNA